MNKYTRKFQALKRLNILGSGFQVGADHGRGTVIVMLGKVRVDLPPKEAEAFGQAMLAESEEVQRVIDSKKTDVSDTDVVPVAEEAKSE